MMQEGFEPASAVARRLFSAIAAGRWLEAAACIDPADVQVQYDAAVAVKLRSRDNPAFAADQEVSAQARRTETSAMSRFARQALLPRARLPFPLSVLAAMSLEELRSQSALDFMGRIMEIREAEFLNEQQGWPTTFEWEDEAAQATRSAELLRVVLGEAQESGDVAHVIFRRVLNEPDGAHLLEPIGCVTFRKLPMGWRVVLSRVPGAKARLDAGPWRALVELRSAWL